MMTPADRRAFIVVTAINSVIVIGLILYLGAKAGAVGAIAAWCCSSALAEIITNAKEFLERESRPTNPPKLTAEQYAAMIKIAQDHTKKFLRPEGPSNRSVPGINPSDPWPR